MGTWKRMEWLGAGIAVLLLTGAGGAMGQDGGVPDSVDMRTTFLVGPDDEPIPLPRLPGPVVIDGRPDEAAWREVAALPLTLCLPVFGGSPSQRSEIRVAYDDDYLYAAGWFYDTEPDGIRINSLYRDRWNGDDAFAIYVDVFNDNRNAKWFGTTPAGIRFDALVTDDGSGENESWDTFWDARSTVTSEGWFTEIRIPFSSLGFQAKDGGATMGLTVTRYISRLNERVTFPAIDPSHAFRQPSVARDVVLEGVRSRQPLYATPYVLLGVDQAPALPPGATRFRTESEPEREVGLDLRYALSSEMTLDVTANTDFAQVEADDEQVNLDRFPLFFPEKRRFFQERSDLFDFPMGMGDRLFHSRQIGLADGVLTPVLGGARLVGRAGAWDMGFLDMQTGNSDAAPGENFAVARVKRGVLNPYSTVGAIATRRAGAGNENLALGLDGTFRLPRDQYLTTRVATTRDGADADSTGMLDRSELFVSWTRPVSRGLGFDVNASRSGDGFRPGLGFQPRRDFTALNGIANWYFLTDRSPIFRRVYPGALAFSTWRNSDGALESGQYAVWIEWDTKAGGGGWIQPTYSVENVAAPFTVGEAAQIPEGRYTFENLQFVWLMPSGRRLRTQLNAQAGTYFDGTREQLILAPTWNLSPGLELGGEYQYTRLRFPKRNEGADIHLARLRLRGALSARASGNAFLQYNSVSDRLALNLRLRYNFAEGTDLWLVFDETQDTERGVDPRGVLTPRSIGRSLVLKYTHTLTFGRPGSS
jgi:hypothetical protein